MAQDEEEKMMKSFFGGIHKLLNELKDNVIKEIPVEELVQLSEKIKSDIESHQSRIKSCNKALGEVYAEIERRKG